MTPLKTGRFIFNPDSIKGIREKAGLSQEQLAKKIGVAKTAISRWEKGMVTPDANSLAAIYSVAKEGRNEPMFFKEKEAQTKSGRSRLIVSWDFQNLPLSWIDIYSSGKSRQIKDEITKQIPNMSYSLYKVFTGPIDYTVANGLDDQGWRVQEFDHNIDQELDAQSWSDCNQVPNETIFVLISKDRDYVELIDELRQKGVMVYLMAPDDGSQRLFETVGKRWRIQYPSNYLPTLNY